MLPRAFFVCVGVALGAVATVGIAYVLAAFELERRR